MVVAGGKKPKGRAPAPRKQYAALPWRRTEDGQVEILLITSRETGRWVIPKGWPIKGLSPQDSAAREAFEEAGVAGSPAAAKLGHYQYDKRLQDGRSQPVRVSVFALEISGEAESWPEQGQREKRWMTPDHAAELVEEPDLKRLLHGFAESGPAAEGLGLADTGELTPHARPD